MVGETESRRGYFHDYLNEISEDALICFIEVSHTSPQDFCERKKGEGEEACVHADLAWKGGEYRKKARHIFDLPQIL